MNLSEMGGGMVDGGDHTWVKDSGPSDAKPTAGGTIVRMFELMLH